MWDPAQKRALDALKGAVTNTPVLCYYHQEEEVTLQCEALQSGLGAALMQHELPVAYASQALTSANTRYAQIGEELLAIVFTCNQFEAFIYGRDLVNVETDHKPLESIKLKSLDSVPRGCKECF